MKQGLVDILLGRLPPDYVVVLAANYLLAKDAAGRHNAQDDFIYASAPRYVAGCTPENTLLVIDNSFWSWQNRKGLYELINVLRRKGFDIDKAGP